VFIVVCKGGGNLEDVICNNVYDELFTEEYNLEIDDFEKCDGGSHVEGNVKCVDVNPGTFFLPCTYTFVGF
jgi:hypothetical protein